MADSIYEKMEKVTAAEIAEAVTGTGSLSPEQLAAADVDGDGKIDAKDVQLMADAQVKLANKISGVIVGMGELTPEEQAVAERNGDGYINLTDGHRLAEDARQAKGAVARARHTGQLK